MFFSGALRCGDVNTVVAAVCKKGLSVSLFRCIEVYDIKIVATGSRVCKRY